MHVVSGRFLEHSAHSFINSPLVFSEFGYSSTNSHQMSSGNGNIFTRGLSRISKRKKKQKSLQSSLVNEQQQHNQQSFETPSIQYERPTIFAKGMDRLRRSLRLPRRRDRSNDRHLSPQATGGSKQDQWQPDESAVKNGTCCFNVKYLGAVEVFEPRGMQVCEGALKSLKLSRRKPVKAVLYVSGDGLRVVDQGNSRGLLVDQTIEKVSFCAPDRNNDKGFAYICRDGTSRRWMCHGFLATKESGERLSHAVGCAFAICLERKKKRDEENAIAANTIPSTSSNVKNDEFAVNWDDAAKNETAVSSNCQRSNLAYQSFRKHVSIEERYLDPQSVIINEVPASNHSDEIRRISKPRPSSNPALFQRQGSLRAPESSINADQFKRNLSLRTNPSIDVSPSKKTFGTTLYNEPIYEGDEDSLGLGIEPMKSTSWTSPVLKNGLEGIDLSYCAKPAPLPHPTSIFTNSTNEGFAQWPENSGESKLSSPLDDIQKQFEEVKINTTNSNSINNGKTKMPSFMPKSASRSKADEWLDDVLRVSMTMSPSSNSSTPMTPSASMGTISSTMTAKSGPPPVHAPPPLPIKQAVSNGNPSIYQNIQLLDSNSRLPSPSNVNWNRSPSSVQPTKIPTKPIDPFDIQWSKLTINNTDAQKIA